MSNNLSVIVPVYNVEKFLHKCLDSIINQSFTDLEIILVNDGSTDSSPEICDNYAKKDSRIKVIHQENSGVSVARNVGIDAANGDYITFVDSDDHLDLEMYKSMFASLPTTAAEVLMCDYIKIDEDERSEISTDLRAGFYLKEQIISEIFPTLIVTEKFGRIPIIAVWSCLFKTSLLRENNIKFDDSLMYSEDYLFMAEVMTKAESFYYLKEKYLYNYLYYEASRSKKYQPEWWENLLHLNLELKNLLINNKEFNFSHQIKLQLIHSVLFVLSGIEKNQTMTRREKKEAISNILKTPALVSAFSDVNLKNQKVTLIFILFLLKYKMTGTYLFFIRMLNFYKTGY